MLENKIFEYCLCDAWHMPISSITILDDENNTVIYSTSKNRSRIHLVPGENTKEISDVAMNKVKNIILESEACEIKDVEDNLNVCVMDGYINEFYISNGKKINEVSALNLKMYKYDADKYPNVCKLIKLLKDLSKVLESEGIDKKYLKL